VAAVSSQKERIDVFFKGADGVLHDTTLIGGEWKDNHISVVKIASNPSPLPNVHTGGIDVFYRSEENQLINTWLNVTSSKWINATLPGEKVWSSPKAVRGLTPDRVDVLWHDKSGDIWDTAHINGSWVTKKISDNGNCDSDVYPVLGFEDGRLACFWKGKDKNLFLSMVDAGNTEHTDQKITQHGQMQGAPFPIEIDGKIHVFWADQAKNIHHSEYSRKTGWDEKVIGGGGKIQSSVISVVAGYQPNRIDLLWISTEAKVHSTTFDGTVWKDYLLGGGGEAHGNVGQPSVSGIINVLPGRIDVFWRHKNGHVWDTCYQDGWKDSVLTK